MKLPKFNDKANTLGPLRARVEVEVASERARLLAQHAATCNCRKAQPPGAGSDP